MQKSEKLSRFYNSQSPWQSALVQIRAFLKTTELQEDWKWSFPTYTLNGQNVIGVASHKKHFSVWFFQGVFLKDKHQLLRNAQEGKTKALRSLCYTEADDLKIDVLKAYTWEAIENSKAGKFVKPQRNTQPIILPTVLEDALNKNSQLQRAFKLLTLAKRRAYADHISTAKKEATQYRRLKTVTPMILEGKGLHDKYK